MIAAPSAFSHALPSAGRSVSAHGRSAQAGDGHDMDHYAADVAAVVGFSSSNSFATAFRKATGITPTTYYNRS